MAGFAVAAAVLASALAVPAPGFAAGLGWSSVRDVFAVHDSMLPVSAGAAQAPSLVIGENSTAEHFADGLDQGSDDSVFTKPSTYIIGGVAFVAGATGGYFVGEANGDDDDDDDPTDPNSLEGRFCSAEARDGKIYAAEFGFTRNTSFPVEPPVLVDSANAIFLVQTGFGNWVMEMEAGVDCNENGMLDQGESAARVNPVISGWWTTEQLFRAKTDEEGNVIYGEDGLPAIDEQVNDFASLTLRLSNGQVFGTTAQFQGAGSDFVLALNLTIDINFGVGNCEEGDMVENMFDPDNQMTLKPGGGCL
jgi:hypothetical protein